MFCKIKDRSTGPIYVGLLEKFTFGRKPKKSIFWRKKPPAFCIFFCHFGKKVRLMLDGHVFWSKKSENRSSERKKLEKGLKNGCFWGTGPMMGGIKKIRRRRNRLTFCRRISQKSDDFGPKKTLVTAGRRFLTISQKSQFFNLFFSKSPVQHLWRTKKKVLINTNPVRIKRKCQILIKKSPDLEKSGGSLKVLIRGA